MIASKSLAVKQAFLKYQSGNASKDPAAKMALSSSLRAMAAAEVA